MLLPASYFSFIQTRSRFSTSFRISGRFFLDAIGVTPLDTVKPLMSSLFFRIVTMVGKLYPTLGQCLLSFYLPHIFGWFPFSFRWLLAPFWGHATAHWALTRGSMQSHETRWGITIPYPMMLLSSDRSTTTKGQQMNQSTSYIACTPQFLVFSRISQILSKMCSDRRFTTRKNIVGQNFFSEVLDS